MPEDGLALGEARMLSANLIAVSYQGEIGLPNPGNITSPLFAGNWYLTAEEVTSQLRLVQSVDVVTAESLLKFTDEFPTLQTANVPLFLVYLDGVLTPGARYAVHLATPEIELTGCECADIVGLTLRREALPTDERDSDGRIRDLANPYLTRDALNLPPRLGTYQLTDEGDLGLDKSLEASLRKRIFRRVSTAVGAFFHLPNYGTPIKLKGLMTVDAVERIQARVRAQVLQEPEVTDAHVSVSQPGGLSILSVSIRAETAGGQTVGTVVPIELP